MTIVKGVWMNVKILKAQGVPLAEIARRLGVDRKTAGKLARAEAEPKPTPRRRRSKLEAHVGWLRDRLAVGVPAAELHRQLLKHGLVVSYGAVRDLARKLRPPKPVAAEEVRFETPPGKQAQVDWSSCGSIWDHGRQRALYLFAMLMCYSRLLFAMWTTRMDEVTLQRCHLAAFAFFGGVPAELLYDNLKTVTTGRDGQGTPVWQSEFADFAGRMGFAPRCARPYRAKTKGKVERVIGFVKGSFLPGRSFVDLDDGQAQLLSWVHDVNGRVHRTHGEIIRERFVLEQPLLLPLRADMTPIERVATRVVNAEGWISYDGNRYELPLGHRGKAVLVRDDGQCLRISHHETLLCQHSKLLGQHQVARRPCERRIITARTPQLVVARRPLSYYEEVTT
jgi:transposase